jgi:hypothetical protein
MAYISVKRQPRRLAALLLAGTCLSPVGASAQTWDGGTGTGFETGANWSTGSAPTSAQTGTFGASANTSVSMTVGGESYGGIQFNAGASAYSFNVTGTPSVSATSPTCRAPSRISPCRAPPLS